MIFFAFRHAFLVELLAGSHPRKGKPARLPRTPALGAHLLHPGGRTRNDPERAGSPREEGDASYSRTGLTSPLGRSGTAIREPRERDAPTTTDTTPRRTRGGTLRHLVSPLRERDEGDPGLPGSRRRRPHLYSAVPSGSGSLPFRLRGRFLEVSGPSPGEASLRTHPSRRREGKFVSVF